MNGVVDFTSLTSLYVKQWEVLLSPMTLLALVALVALIGRKEVGKAWDVVTSLTYRYLKGTKARWIKLLYSPPPCSH